jgi:hypothetical protein
MPLAISRLRVRGHVADELWTTADLDVFSRLREFD